jgi:hypothetical protein
VIKIVLASIDALVEKEVIPEVSEELSCTEGACDLNRRPFFVSSGQYRSRDESDHGPNRSHFKTCSVTRLL